MKVGIGSLAAIGLSALVGTARADAVDDVKNGTQIRIEIAQGHIEDMVNRVAGMMVTKPAGTLSFTMPASAIGVNLPITLHLVGAKLDATHVQFTFDDSFSPSVDISGDDDMLTRAWGQLVISAAVMPGIDSAMCDHTACPFDVRMNLESGWVTGRGSWGDETSTIDMARAVAGVPRAKAWAFLPPVAHDAHGNVTAFCTSPTQKTASFEVVLASVAPATGARVDFTWPRSAGLSFPDSIVVPPGKDTATVGLRIPANFVGLNMQFAAAAGGVNVPVTFSVHPAADCAEPPSGPRYIEWIPDALAGCTACSAFLDFNNEGDALIDQGGSLEFLHAGVLRSLSRLYAANAIVNAKAMTDTGMIVGRMSIDGQVQGYRVDLEHGAGAPVALGAITPLAVSSAGTAFGYHLDANGNSQSAYSRGDGMKLLPITSSYGVRASRILFVNDHDQVAGTFTDTSGVVRGFRWVNGATTTMPNVGTQPGLPAGLNSENQILLNGANASGPVAAIQVSGTTTLLGVPSGYTSFRGVAINRWGNVVGVATLNGVSRVYVWRPGRGFLAISGYVAGLVADDAFALNDANQLVVHGTAGTTTTLYLVTL